MSASRGRLRVETSLHICVLLIKIKGRRQTNSNTNQLFITATIISSVYSLTSLVLCVSGDQNVQSCTAFLCRTLCLQPGLWWSVVHLGCQQVDSVTWCPIILQVVNLVVRKRAENLLCDWLVGIAFCSRTVTSNRNLV